MNNLAKLAAALVGLFSIVMGLMAWVDPAKVGGIIGLEGVGVLGEHSLRGDVGAVFLASALGCGLALFKGKTVALKIPIIIYGLVLIGRLISLVAVGAGEGVMQPILIEVALVALSIFAYRTLSKA
ncbi:MAG: DUF4345 family protein [Hyphomonadaceae bacterium]|nr:DUF4345 family protein [Hyphomonadaceae bacterium]